MNAIERKIVLCDVDGTLCSTTAWNIDDCMKAKPILAHVEKLNRLYEKNFIIIYTARRDCLIEATIYWLKKHGIKFHAFSNNKIPGNIILDEDSAKFADIEI